MPSAVLETLSEEAKLELDLLAFEQSEVSESSFRFVYLAVIPPTMPASSR